MSDGGIAASRAPFVVLRLCVGESLKKDLN